MNYDAGDGAGDSLEIGVDIYAPASVYHLCLTSVYKLCLPAPNLNFLPPKLPLPSFLLLTIPVNAHRLPQRPINFLWTQSHAGHYSREHDIELETRILKLCLPVTTLPYPSYSVSWLPGRGKQYVIFWQYFPEDGMGIQAMDLGGDSKSPCLPTCISKASLSLPLFLFPITWCVNMCILVNKHIFIIFNNRWLHALSWSFCKGVGIPGIGHNSSL